MCRVCRMLTGILLVFLSGCATTTLTGVWKNPEYSGKTIHKVLVVGVARQDTYRRIFEDEFSRELQARGVSATPSYTLFTLEELKNEKAAAAKVKARGFDFMIISKITGRQNKEMVTPGSTYVFDGNYEPPFYHLGWYDYYSRSFEIVHEPSQVIKYEVVTAESNLYDVKTGALIWSAVSDTVVQGSKEELIKSFVQEVVANLANMQLL